MTSNAVSNGFDFVVSLIVLVGICSGFEIAVSVLVRIVFSASSTPWGFAVQARKIRARIPSNIQLTIVNHLV